MIQYVWLLWIFWLISTAGQAQQADDILAQYYRRTGGVRAWKQLKTITLEGAYPSRQGHHNFVLYKKYPNLIKLVVRVNGHEIVPQAYDGTTAWTLNPLMGSDSPQKLPEAVARQIAANAEFQDALIDYAAKGHGLSYTGTQEVEGAATYVLKLEKNKHNPEADLTEFYYFDQTTYLPVMIKTVGPSGKESFTYLYRYQQTDGKLIMPFEVASVVNGQTVSKMVFDKITLNPKIKDRVFEFPED